MNDIKTPHGHLSISEIETDLFLGNKVAGGYIPALEDHRITAIVSLGSTKGMSWSWMKWRVLFPESHRLFIACLDSDTQDMLVNLATICNFIDAHLSGSVTRTELPLNYLDSIHVEPSEEPAQQGEPSTAQSMEFLTAPGEPSLEAPPLSEKKALWTSIRKLQRGEESDFTRGPPRVLVHCRVGASRSPMVIIAYLMWKRREKLNTALEAVKSKRKIKLNPNFMEQLKVWEEVGYEIWEDAERTVPKPAYAEYLCGRAERLKKKGLTGDEPIGIQNL